MTKPEQHRTPPTTGADTSARQPVQPPTVSDARPSTYPLPQQPIRRPIRLAIVAGYALIREALEELFAHQDEVDIVASGATPAEAVNLVRAEELDALLLVHTGSAMDELDIVQRVGALDRNTRLLVLSTETSESSALRMLRAGAHGILVPETTADTVTEALHTVHRGEMYLTRDLQRACAERYLGVAPDRSPEDNLTDREYQVLRLLANGYINREIAEQLGVGVKTIDTHRANLLRKLGLRHNVDLVRFAIRQRLVEP